LADFFIFAEIILEPGATASGNKSTGNLIMKKILLLATLFGLAATLSAKGAEAKENWDKICAKCHGADGKGQTKMGQKLGIKDSTDAKFQDSFTDEVAFKALKEGLKDADGKTLMIPAATLTDDEIKAMVAYVRSLKK
jgi:mono/diheme cytochrome c family protein